MSLYDHMLNLIICHINHIISSDEINALFIFDRKCFYDMNKRVFKLMSLKKGKRQVV